MHGDVAWSGSARRLPVQQRQLARRLDGEGADGAGPLPLELADLAHGVQELPARVKGQERRPGSGRGQLDRIEPTGRQVEPPEVDTFAFRVGVGAEVHPQRLWLRR
jgi:hypothetical protein